MGILRSRDKDEIIDIAYRSARQMGVGWEAPVAIKRAGLRKWRVQSAGTFAGGHTEVIVDDRSGDVDDIKIIGA